jgi:hypothetical protein
MLAQPHGDRIVASRLVTAEQLAVVQDYFGHCALGERECERRCGCRIGWRGHNCRHWRPITNEAIAQAKGFPFLAFTDGC